MSATTIAGVEQELAELREASSAPGSAPSIRTSVMTHLAWVPAQWQEQAERTLAGLADRHPSRTILLLPRPDAADGLELSASVECFPYGDRSVCAEVIRAYLDGSRAQHPASVVLPLLIAELPVFLRWRGLPEFDEVFDEMVGVVDRLIVDSTEWPSNSLSLGFFELAQRFDRAVVSDIAWARTERWRRVLADAWPFEGRELSVQATYAQGRLLQGWLESKLGHDVALEVEPAERLVAVFVDGERVDAPAGDPPPSSELLSDELDTYTRDPAYEAAVRAAAAS